MLRFRKHKKAGTNDRRYFRRLGCEALEERQLLSSATVTTVNSSANPATVGQQVAFMATVAAASGSAPQGEVDWYIDSSTVRYAAASLVNGVAQGPSVTSLLAGQHTITANYLGNSNYNPSSCSLIETVNPVAVNTTTVVTSSANPSTVGQQVTFMATVAAVSGSTPQGEVDWYIDSSTVRYAAASLVNGVAQGPSVTSLSAGQHTITAKYLGNSNYNASSYSYTQTVNPVAVNIVVTYSPNPATAGQPVTFTATASAADGSTPQGEVDWYIDSTTTRYAAASLVNGVAQGPSLTLSAGQHTITVKYLGDGNHAASSGSFRMTVNPVINTATAVTSSANPSTVGQQVTFTATVSAADGSTPQGEVDWYIDSSTVRYAAASLVNAVAQGPSLTNLSAGQHTITAKYLGNSSYNPSSYSYTQTVNALAVNTTTAVTSSANPSTVGQPVTFTATVSAADGSTPQGEVDWYVDSSTVRYAAASLVNGVAQGPSLASLSAGKHTITADYLGNSNYNPSSYSYTQTVNPVAVNIVVMYSPNPPTAGQPVTFTATVSAADGSTPQGEVDWYIDSSTVRYAAASLVNGVAQGPSVTLSAGQHTITVKYLGDGIHASGSGSFCMTVNPVINTTTAVTSSANPSTVGQAVTFTATVSAADGSTPQGEVDWYVDSTTTRYAAASLVNGVAQGPSLTNLSAGQHTITAKYLGNSNYAASSGSFSQTVNAVINTTTAVTSSANPSTVGQQVTFTATVSAADGSTPQGEVDWYIDSTTTRYAAASLVNGVAQGPSLTNLSAGQHTITAKYLGNSNYAASSGSFSQTVNAVVNTATAVTSSANPSTAGQAVTFTATVSAADGSTPQGEVDWYIDSTTTQYAAASLVNGVAQGPSLTNLSAGQHTITAKYLGNSNYAASSGSFSQTVNAVINTTTAVDVNEFGFFALSATVSPVAPGAGTPNWNCGRYGNVDGRRRERRCPPSRDAARQRHGELRLEAAASRHIFYFLDLLRRFELLGQHREHKLHGPPERLHRQLDRFAESVRARAAGQPYRQRRAACPHRRLGAAIRNAHGHGGLRGQRGGPAGQQHSDAQRRCGHLHNFGPGRWQPHAHGGLQRRCELHHQHLQPAAGIDRRSDGRPYRRDGPHRQFHAG